MRRAGTGRLSWLLVIAIIVGFYIVEHQKVPTVSLPATYTMVGKDMRIPVHMARAGTGQTGWALARTSQGVYVALLYQNGQLAHQFRAATKAAPQTGSGTTGHTYAATGQVSMGGALYRVATIHINPDGKSGYVQLNPEGKRSGSQNGTAPSTGNTAP